MNVKVKKLYKGRASIRDYIVSKCYRAGEDLVISFGSSSMTVKNKDLPMYERQTKKKIKSKFDGKEYFLCDFLFEEYADTEMREMQGADGGTQAPSIFTNKDEQKTLF